MPSPGVNKKVPPINEPTWAPSAVLAVLKQLKAGGAAPGQGRGGGPLAGPAVVPGRYTATLGKLVGETVTPYGPGVTFFVKALER